MAEKSTFSKAKEGLKAALSVKDFFQTMKGYWGVFSWALICDALSSIPWVGLIFSGLGYGSIWVYLEMKGVSASPVGSTKRMASFGAEWVAGALGFGIVPGVSFWTYYSIAEYKENETKKQQKELAEMENSIEETQQKLARDAINNREGGKQTETQMERRKKSAYYNS